MIWKWSESDIYHHESPLSWIEQWIVKIMIQVYSWFPLLPLQLQVPRSMLICFDSVPRECLKKNIISEHWENFNLHSTHPSKFSLRDTYSRTSFLTGQKTLKCQIQVFVYKHIPWPVPLYILKLFVLHVLLYLVLSFSNPKSFSFLHYIHLDSYGAWCRASFANGICTTGFSPFL